MLCWIKAELTSSTGINTLMPTAYLYINDELIASTSTGTAGELVFVPDDEITIAKDDTATLTLKVDVASLDSGNDYGVAASATIDVSDDITAADASTYGTVTPTGSDATGKTQYFYPVAPTVELVDATLTPDPLPGGSNSSGPVSASGKIKLNITANGGDVYIKLHSDTAASSGIVVC